MYLTQLSPNKPNLSMSDLQLSFSQSKLASSCEYNNQDEITLLAAAVHNAHDSIVITTTNLDYPGPEIIFVNRAFTRMTGYKPSEIIGKTPRILQGPNTDREVFKELKDKLRNGKIFFGEAINYRKDGTEFWNQWHIEPIYNELGELTHYLAIQRDVSQQKESEKQLVYSAFHDALTGLHNRAWFLEQLQNCIVKANEYQDYLFALLFLDLDGFKLINDTLGHTVGDLFLQQVAQRLKQSIRHQDKLARLGGDEFTIIIEDIEDLSIVSLIADRIQKSLQQPFMLNNQEMFTSGSIGITLSSLGYEKGEEMLRDADLAMYRAKSLGKSRYAIFNKTMHSVAVKRLSLESYLRKALEKEELEVFYQPIVETNDYEIVGFEALLRWHHPELGLVSPVRFIPIAEEMGLIVEIGEWVMRCACLQSKEWQSLIPHRQFFMNINLSPRQFRYADLVSQIEAILTETNCDRRLIKLEITESALQAQEKEVDVMLNQLNDLGIRLCIDDFGTGYSSLSRLYKFPIDTLKIDSCFTRAIGKNERKEKILETIITLAHNLDMNVVAEGVETEFQLAKIKANQCEFVQGYLFGKPMNNKQMELVLHEKYIPIKGIT